MSDIRSFWARNNIPVLSQFLIKSLLYIAYFSIQVKTPSEFRNVFFKRDQAERAAETLSNKTSQLYKHIVSDIWVQKTQVIPFLYVTSS